VALIALLALLVAWAVTSGSSKGNKDDSRPNGSGPAHSIGPGPASSGPAISQQPGGRDESGTGGSGGAGGADAGSDGTGGTGDGSNGDADAGSGPGSGSASGGGTEGRQVPAGSSIPDCTPSTLQLTLRTGLTYGPGEKPKFQLIAKNTSSTACKADLGPRSAVLTITEAGGDDSEVWSSKDCPRNAGSVLLEVPAGAAIVHTVEWDRKKSAPQCATPPAESAGPGTYLVEAKVTGEPLQRASFVLAKD
jgi:hypothetical protein